MRDKRGEIRERKERRKEIRRNIIVRSLEVKEKNGREVVETIMKEIGIKVEIKEIGKIGKGGEGELWRVKLENEEQKRR